MPQVGAGLKLALPQKRGRLVFLAVAARAEVSASRCGRSSWLRSLRVARSRDVAERLEAASGSAIEGERSPFVVWAGRGGDAV